MKINTTTLLELAVWIAGWLCMEIMFCIIVGRPMDFYRTVTVSVLFFIFRSIWKSRKE